MKIVLVAAGLVVVAALALSASLVPAARVTPVSVSVAVPGVPVTAVQAPVLAQAAPAVKKPATLNSITRSADSQAETAPPVVPAPVPATAANRPAGGADLGSDSIAPKIVQVPTVCAQGHSDKKQCRPRLVPQPANDD
jgi:hypothetical protein